ncbi:MAG: hypothetical protein WC529_00015 [Candidatus Margulisiibacteriota bacterium]
MKAYKTTTVNWAKSQTAIVKMLNQRGIYQTRFTNAENRFAIEFLAKLPDQEKPVGVRILVPIIVNFPKTRSGNIEKKYEQELNRLHRILFYHLKAKFVAIDNGLTEFMEEFMPHLIISDGRGNSSTLGQVLLPQYKEQIESGKQKEFLLLPETVQVEKEQ